MTTSPRPSARGGIQARKINAQERLEGSLYERQALTDYGEIRARVQSEAVICPYCEKETYVHPDNFAAHCANNHSSEALTLVASDVRNHILKAHGHAYAAGELIHQANQQLARKGNGKFGHWIAAELTGMSRSQAYNLMNIYLTYKDRPIIGQTLGRTALFLLASAPDSALDEVETLINDGDTPDTNTVKIIAKAHKNAALVAQTYGITDAQVIGALSHLATSNKPLLESILVTGWIQPGNESEAVQITDNPDKVTRAIKEYQKAQIPQKKSRYPDLKVQLIGGLPVIVGFTDWQQAEDAVLELMNGKGRN